MKDPAIKVCGMKDPDNIRQVIELKPQYIGFILYEKSPRYVSIDDVAELVKLIPGSVKKVGVIVNEPFANALKIIKSGFFDMIQLHGDETSAYCKKLSEYIEIIKAFRISESLPQNISSFQPYCTKFLFDTAGNDFGGTGKKFDHQVLDNYSYQTKYFLSGGVSPSDADYIRSLDKTGMAGIDLNSRFEITQGIKDIRLLKKFISKIREHVETN
jgi:phosphoribosylanthranilate isomerase